MKAIHPTTRTGKILMYLSRNLDEWHTWGESMYMPSVQQVFPAGTSEKVQLRFMKRLQRMGLVGGCDCGCRGDYEITEAGLEFLALECPGR